MNTSAKEKILNEAIRIGDELISKSEKNEYGIYWKSMSVDDDNKPIWGENEGIYQGVGGIALFFLELFKQTKNATGTGGHPQGEKYLATAISAANWIEDYCKKNPTDYYAFFTGRMGVSYVMLQFATITGDKKYIQSALDIAKEAPKFFQSKRPIDDLINGISGTLFGLLHLHAATKEEWVLSHINRFTEALIERAHVGSVGLYWDKSHQHIRGLCGFSHGASGIGFVFLELGRYFNNPAFYWMAEQAFAYENHFFDNKLGNWPDFRRGIFKPADFEEQKEKYYAGDIDFFTKGNDMSAWCHGAPGIGLARIRANELLNNPDYKQDLERAIEKTKRTTVDYLNPNVSFNLCHGGGGNADLFIEAYGISQEQKYLEYAQRVAEKALEYRKQTGIYYSGFNSVRDQENTSLFMGNAGIGYFYLRVLDPLNTPCILSPVLKHAIDKAISAPEGMETHKQHAAISISLAEIKKNIVSKSYPRTLRLVTHLYPEKVSEFFSGPSQHEPKGFESFIKGLLEKNSKEVCLKDIFELEKSKKEIEDTLPSRSLLYLKQLLFAEKARELLALEAKEFSSLELQFNPDVSLRTTKWDWSFENMDHHISYLNIAEDEYYVLLQPTHQTVVEKNMAQLTHIILNVFQKERQSVSHVIQQVVKEFEVNSPEEEQQVKEIILTQIKELLASGIVMVSHLTPKGE